MKQEPIVIFLRAAAGIVGMIAVFMTLFGLFIGELSGMTALVVLLAILPVGWALFDDRVI